MASTGRPEYFHSLDGRMAGKAMSVMLELHFFLSMGREVLILGP